ncbi:unnamed protein product [Periconia digitata]|uniref:Uncharacterized protein n=1 Tax=Periconia digitata TaxID=1303443 RepID=A0A9W4UFL2_9PLEO|nr:unnamed protein product [Periconia digitata]
MAVHLTPDPLSFRLKSGGLEVPGGEGDRRSIGPSGRAKLTEDICVQEGNSFAVVRYCTVPSYEHGELGRLAVVISLSMRGQSVHPILCCKQRAGRLLTDRVHPSIHSLSHSFIHSSAPRYTPLHIQSWVPVRACHSVFCCNVGLRTLGASPPYRIALHALPSTFHLQCLKREPVPVYGSSHHQPSMQGPLRRAAAARVHPPCPGLECRWLCPCNTCNTSPDYALAKSFSLTASLLHPTGPVKAKVTTSTVPWHRITCTLASYCGNNLLAAS